MRIDLDMMALAFNEAHHHLVALILYVMTIQIIFDLCLYLRIPLQASISCHASHARNARYASQAIPLHRRAGECIGGTYQCHKG